MTATVEVERIRAVLRLIAPDHITPVGARQIERVLQEADEMAGIDSRCARCGSAIPFDQSDPRNDAMRVCNPCAIDLDEEIDQ